MVDIYGYLVGKHTIFAWIRHMGYGIPRSPTQVGATSLLVTGSGTDRTTLVLGYAIGKCLEGQIAARVETLIVLGHGVILGDVVISWIFGKIWLDSYIYIYNILHSCKPT